MGQPSDMAQIPSTPRLHGVMLGAISFSVPTARVALMAYVAARFVEFRYRCRSESNRSEDETDPAPMPPHPRTDPARQHRFPRTTKTGARRILPTHRGPRRALCEMPYA